MKFTIELSREVDGRWIAEIPDVAGCTGCMVYGDTKEEAIRNVKVLALKVLAEQLEFEEKPTRTDVTDLSFILA